MIEKMIAISQKKMPGNLEVVQCALFLYTYVVHFAPPSFTSLSLTLSNISMMVQRGDCMWRSFIEFGHLCLSGRTV